MRFLDSSAIIPLLVKESTSAFCLDYIQKDPANVVVWWGAPIECVSAICRKERQGTFTANDVSEALARLRVLRATWSEVNPTATVRRDAERLLRLHPLSAADALQLAAVVAVSGENRSAVEFLTFDTRLREAADREGFCVVGASRDPGQVH